MAEFELQLDLKQDSQGVIVPVSAQPGARWNGIVGVRNGMLRVAVTAAPEKGKANRAIVRVLSDALDVPKSAIELLSGETAGKKRFLVYGGAVRAIGAALARFLEQNEKS
jgi:uncharacterized protein (TIGR00251 family)